MNDHPLLTKIKETRARVGIIGLGYVGLPLARAIMKQGYHVTGYDTDPEKIEALQSGSSYIDPVSDDFIQRMLERERFIPTNEAHALRDVDIILICVPTPLKEDKKPNTSYIKKTAETIREHLQPEQLVVLESTTFPGTTEEVVIPILNEGDLEAGDDFFVAYSPERENPGSDSYTTERIPKVVGGMDEASSILAREFYQQITVGVVAVSGTREAEASKLLENIYRAVNIALVNELKGIFSNMNIDVWEVIEAASTKPFGFQAFYPGPGLGGHCIPIDPYFLSWKAEQHGMEAQLIELAGHINTSMPSVIVETIQKELMERDRTISDSNGLILGAAYKKDVDDIRGSPTLKLLKLLEDRGGSVDYHDPHIPEIKDTRNYPGQKTSVSGYPGVLEEYDYVLISTDHSAYKPEEILQNASLIFDSRNLLGQQAKEHDHVIRV